MPTKAATSTPNKAFRRSRGVAVRNLPSWPGVPPPNITVDLTGFEFVEVTS